MNVHQRIEVIEAPEDRGKSARLLESTRSSPAASPDVGKCGGCSHDEGERAVPPEIQELQRRFKVLSWMERNIEHLHEVFNQDSDSQFSSSVLSTSVSSFVDVIEEMIFFCDEQRFWAAKHENGVSPCVFLGVIDDLEKKLLFYGKESTYLMSLQ